MITPGPAAIRRVFVPDGNCFVGRHAVVALLSAGATVIVGSRRPGDADPRIPAIAAACEQRRCRLDELLKPSDWMDLVADADAVLNCVGMLRQVGSSTYDKVHHRALTALARACALAGKRFVVHVSALGLHPDARSRFLTPKLAACPGASNAWCLPPESHTPGFQPAVESRHGPDENSSRR